VKHKSGPWSYGPRSNKKGASDWTDADYANYWKSRCIINPVTGCWEWQGHRTVFMSGRTPIPNKGYGTSSYRGQNSIRIHRKMLEFKLGRPIGPKMQSCHTCDVPWCINPDHLYEGDNRRNHLDGGQRKRMQGQTKTHCVHGHEYTPENTIVVQRGHGASSRHCRECFRQIGYRRHWGLPSNAPVPPRQLPIRTRRSQTNQEGKP
jgi:hypothetical protein